MSEKIKVERLERDVIQRALLDSISDGETVAILADRDDLDLLIGALENYNIESQRRDVFINGLKQLRKEAFFS